MDILTGIGIGICAILLVQFAIRYYRNRAMQESNRIDFQRVGTTQG